MEEDIVELGGSIELSGFSDIDGGSMIVLKKIVGNYARKFSEKAKDFEKLKLHMKSVHEREKSEKYEIHGQVILAGKPISIEVTDRNMFFVLDKVMKKLESNI